MKSHQNTDNPLLKWKHHKPLRPFKPTKNHFKQRKTTTNHENPTISYKFLLKWKHDTPWKPQKKTPRTTNNNLKNTPNSDKFLQNPIKMKARQTAEPPFFPSKKKRLKTKSLKCYTFIQVPIKMKARQTIEATKNTKNDENKTTTQHEAPQKNTEITQIPTNSC